VYMAKGGENMSPLGRLGGASEVAYTIAFEANFWDESDHGNRLAKDGFTDLASLVGEKKQPLETTSYG
jgi:hypothetical protein